MPDGRAMKKNRGKFRDVRMMDDSPSKIVKSIFCDGRDELQDSEHEFHHFWIEK
jgi:hypothetical protein